MKETFSKGFAAFACIGDTIEAPTLLGGFRTGLRLEAKIYEDDDKTPPDQRQDGYWPSLDPESDGYIGPKSESTLRRHTAKAKAVLEAWRNDEWQYCGICVRAWFDDIPLTDEYGFALWGIEMNYPGSKNEYLREVANELADECARQAIRELTALVESTQ